MASVLGVIMLLGTLPGAARAANAPGTVTRDPSGTLRFVLDPSLYQANELAKAHGGFGAYRDAPTQQIVVRMPTAGTADLTAADIASVGAPVDVLASRFDSASIAAMESEVEGLHTRLTLSQAFVSGYDIAKDVFAIRSNASESTFADFEAKYPGKVAYTYGDVARTNRHDDTPAHWGGAELWLNGQLDCTSGYPILVGAATYMVTAGHCFNQGATVLGGTGQNWGTIRSRRDYPNTDVELIGGSSYGPDIYVSYSGSAFVHGYAPGQVNTYPYCLSGAYSGTYCDYTETADNQNRTDSVGTTTGLVELRGHGDGFGDSGGPAYVTSNGYVYILGSAVAGQPLCSPPPCYIWIEPWYSRVRSLYGASLVTG